MTPRELALLADGYRWRDRRAWEVRAIELAYLLSPWRAKGSDGVTPQQILDTVFPPTDPANFERLAGLIGAGDAIDEMVRRQQARRLPST